LKAEPGNHATGRRRRQVLTLAAIFGAVLALVLAAAWSAPLILAGRRMDRILEAVRSGDKAAVYDAQRELQVIPESVLASRRPLLARHYAAVLGDAGSDTWTRVNAVKMLVWLGAGEELAAALGSPYPEVRAWAAKFAGELTDPKVAAALVGLLGDRAEVTLSHPTPVGMGPKPRRGVGFDVPDSTAAGAGSGFPSGRVGWGKDTVGRNAADGLMKILGLPHGAWSIESPRALAIWQKYGDLRFSRAARLEKMLADRDPLVRLDAASALLFPKGVHQFLNAERWGPDRPGVPPGAISPERHAGAVKTLRELLKSGRQTKFRSVATEAAMGLAALGLGDGRGVLNRELGRNVMWVLPFLARVADTGSVPFLTAELRKPENDRVVSSGGGGIVTTMTPKGPVTKRTGRFKITIKDKVASVLKKVTGQDFGTDADAWEKWWESRGGRRPAK